jgi:hypothetical protein
LRPAQANPSLAAIREHELIAVHILNDCHRSPHFRLGLGGEFDAFGFQDLARREHVVAPERQRLKGADAIFVALGRVQRQLRVGAGNQQLDPALLLVEGLVGENLKPSFSV